MVPGDGLSPICMPSPHRDPVNIIREIVARGDCDHGTPYFLGVLLSALGLPSEESTEIGRRLRAADRERYHGE